MDAFTQCANHSVGPANQLFGLLMQTLLAAQCSISPPTKWPQDYGPTALEKGLQEYDFIVVGAGSAGSVVASRLSENPDWKVLLLEAGGDPPIESEVPSWYYSMQQTPHDWGYLVEKTNRSCRATKKGCYWTRGKMLGGNSAINAMQYLRGNQNDYNTWESLGNPTWGWTDVLPYFKKSEANEHFSADYSDSRDYHSNSGEINVGSFMNAESLKNIVMEAGQENGYEYVEDINAHNPLGYSIAQGTISKGSRQSAAKVFLIPNQNRPNLHILKHTHVTKVKFSKDYTANEIELLYNGTKLLTAFSRKEIILSAGPVGNPQLLMLSGIGPERHLKKFDIPVIKALPAGKNLQDHIVVPLFFQFHKSESYQLSKAELLDSIYMYAIHQMGPLTSHGATDLVAFLNTANHTGYPDIQTHHMSFRKSAFDLQFYLTTSGYEEMIGHQILDMNKLGDILVVYVGLLKPKSKGQIKLRSIDPIDKPKILANYLENDEDVETLVRALKFQADYVNTKSFKSHEGALIRLPLMGCKSMEYQSDEYWRCYISYMTRSMNHQFGTTKMGPPNDKNAVVDARLLVHGIRGLRIVGSSIMPAAVSAHTNIATYMIGEKAADFIQEDWTYKNDEL